MTVIISFLICITVLNFIYNRTEWFGFLPNECIKKCQHNNESNKEIINIGEFINKGTIKTIFSIVPITLKSVATTQSVKCNQSSHLNFKCHKMKST